jgi:uncharacterized repeat protein (TIGR01451 family)
MYNICKTTAAAIAFALGAAFAQAAPISGSISFSGGGLTVPPVPSTWITGLLNFITQGPPVANSCSGSFSTGPSACDLSGPVTAGNFSLCCDWPVTIYTYGGFTFELLSVRYNEFDFTGLRPIPDPASDQFGDSATLRMEGVVSGNGFDPTPFSATWTAQGSCSGPYFSYEERTPPYFPTCTANVTASWSVIIETPMPELSVVKTPDSGSFHSGAQAAFTIVVRNAGAGTATNVTLTDQLSGYGGLVWSSVSTDQGTCTTPIVGNLLSCALGTIEPQGSVTVNVSSTAGTPDAACQRQLSTASAAADGGLSASDSGSLNCTPASMPPPGDALLRFWTLTDVRFDDGTIATGYFGYDDATKKISSWNVHVADLPFVPFPSFTYVPGNSAAYIPVEMPQTLALSAEIGVPGASFGLRQLRITPLAALDGSNASVPLATSLSREEISTSEPTRFRSIIAGSLAPMPAPPPVVVVQVDEFYHAGLQHYFITADDAEKQILDTGVFPGWGRTGESFRAYAPGSRANGSINPVCRYYGHRGLDSHFYAADSGECATVFVTFASEWLLESDNVFQIDLPDKSTGACPNGTVPIYRLLNQRGDSDHRYATNLAIRDQMLAAGYVAEGYGADRVVMCAVQ